MTHLLNCMYTYIYFYDQNNLYINFIFLLLSLSKTPIYSAYQIHPSTRKSLYKLYCSKKIHRQQFTDEKFTVNNSLRENSPPLAIPRHGKLTIKKFMQLIFRVVNCHDGEFSHDKLLAVSKLLTMNLLYAKLYIRKLKLQL